MRAFAASTPKSAPLQCIAHLGNGASLCAMHNRNSIATTMGFTALDGLVMGTRCGSIDPGVLFYLICWYSPPASVIARNTAALLQN